MTSELTAEEREVLLRALLRTLPVRRVGENLFLLSTDIAALSDQQLVTLRALADIRLPAKLRYRYGSGTLTPKGQRLSVVRALLEALQMGKPFDYRGGSIHGVKYLLGPATLENLQYVHELGGQLVSTRAVIVRA